MSDGKDFKADEELILHPPKKAAKKDSGPSKTPPQGPDFTIGQPQQVDDSSKNEVHTQEKKGPHSPAQFDDDGWGDTPVQMRDQ